MNSKTCKKKVSKRTNTKNGGNINQQRISCKSVILDNRLDRCNYIINKFLNASKWNSILYYIDNKYIKLDKIILNFDKVIGEGSFGKVILSSINHNNKIYNISIKIIKINNDINLLKSEINLIKRASYFLEKKINPHFLFYYGYIMFDEYVVIIFEKLSGSVMDKTMENILNTVQDPNKYLSNLQNIVTQIFLSIFSFHKFTGHYHNDTKFDNFLYIYDETVKNNNNYYIYEYNNKKYYLPCTNFVIIIADYGFARQINNNNIIYSPAIGRNPFNEKYSAKYTNMIVDYVSVIDSLYIFKYNIQDIIKKFLNDVKNFLLNFDNNYINLIKNVNDVNKYENLLLEKLIEQPWFKLKRTTQQNVINNKNPYKLVNY